MSVYKNVCILQYTIVRVEPRPPALGLSAWKCMMKTGSAYNVSPQYKM